MQLHRTVRAGMAGALAASALTVAALAPGSGPAGAATSCAASNLPKSGTVNITFWEAMSSANETEIQALVAAFNKSQSKVHVTDVNQSGGYEQTWNDYLADLNTSSEPNVVMLDQYITQGAVDSKSIVPVATCIASTKYSTSTFAKKTIAEETVGGKLQGLPYSVSAPILIYNKKSFAAAKITAPPTTIAQMAADAKKMKGTTVSSGGKNYKNTEGMTIKLDPWYLQVYQGMGNGYFVNNQNGRSKRATAAGFNNAVGTQVFSGFQNIVKAGDATVNPSTGSINQAYANLYAIGYGYSGMTIDSSATLGTIIHDIPLFPNVSLGVAALPKLSSSATGGVQPGGNALFLPSYSNSSAAKLAASWEFIQWLDSATELSTWDAKTGYVPITTTAAKAPAMVTYWKHYPFLKVAYTEIMTGTVNNATVGPLLGDYYTVNNDLAGYETTLMTSPFPAPSSELSQAATKVTSDIQSYNSSL